MLFWRSRQSKLDKALHQLTSDKAEMRWQAIMKLRERGNTRAVDPLIGIMKEDVSLRARQEAALALGTIGDKRALQPLIAALSISGLEVTAVTALGELGDPSAIEALVLASEFLPSIGDTLTKIDPNWMASEGARAAVVSIVKPLNDNDPTVYRNAVARLKVFRRIREPEWMMVELNLIFKPLIRALADRDKDIRCAAGKALTLLDWAPKTNYERVVYDLACTRSSWEPTDSWQNRTLKERTRVGFMGGAAVSPLLSLLKHEDPLMRTIAAQKLAENLDSIPLNMEVINGLASSLNESDPTVRQIVIMTYRMLIPESAMKKLCELSEEGDTDSRKAATQILDVLLNIDP